MGVGYIVIFPRGGVGVGIILITPFFPVGNSATEKS